MAEMGSGSVQKKAEDGPKIAKLGPNRAMVGPNMAMLDPKPVEVGQNLPSWTQK